MTSNEQQQAEHRKWGVFSSLTLQRDDSERDHYHVIKPTQKREKQRQQHKHDRDTGHAIAHFQRNEITTGTVLPLMDTTYFEFLDVTGIQQLDSTDVMTDWSAYQNHDDNNYEHHHRIFPEVKVKDDEEEQARIMVQAQSRTVTGKTPTFNRPLHKYMIKQVHHSKCANPEQAMAHLAHETQLWKKLRHPNLLTLRGTTLLVGGDGNNFFLLTDRVSETLAQRLQRWRKSQGSTKHTLWFQKKTITKAQVDPSSRDFRLKLGYAFDLASALAFLHSHNIVVRNLCPETIGFLASDDTLQLMDLGQATTSNSDSTTLTKEESHQCVNSELLLHQQEQQPLFQMTPGGMPFRYMAPELLLLLLPASKGPSGCSKTVDSYSWAMIAMELVTLHQPFGKMKAGQHLKQVVLRNPSMRPHLEVYQLPKVLESLLKKAWRQEPSQRWEADRIRARLETILEKELYNNHKNNNPDLQAMVIEFEDED